MIHINYLLCLPQGFRLQMEPFISFCGSKFRLKRLRRLTQRRGTESVTVFCHQLSSIRRCISPYGHRVATVVPPQHSNCLVEAAGHPYHKSRGAIHSEINLKNMVYIYSTGNTSFFRDFSLKTTLNTSIIKLFRNFMGYLS